MPNTLAPPEIHYPSGDGEPMAETHIHVQAIVHLNQAMEDFFRDREDVFIASDIFWYWMEGNSDLDRRKGRGQQDHAQVNGGKSSP